MVTKKFMSFILMAALVVSMCSPFGVLALPSGQTGAREDIIIRSDGIVCSKHTELDSSVQSGGIATEKWTTSGGDKQTYINKSFTVSSDATFHIEVYNPTDVVDKYIAVYFTNGEIQDNVSWKLKGHRAKFKITSTGWSSFSIKVSDLTESYGGVSDYAYTQLQLHNVQFMDGADGFSTGDCTHLNIGKIWFSFPEPNLEPPVILEAYPSEPVIADKNVFDIASYNRESTALTRLTLDESITFNSTASAKWNVGTPNRNLSFDIGVGADKYDYLYMLLYSPIATESQILLLFNEKPNNKPDSYVVIDLNFNSWKLIKIPVSDLNAQNQSLALSKINCMQIFNSGYTEHMAGIVGGLENINIQRIWLSNYNHDTLNVISKNIIDGYDSYDAHKFECEITYAADIKSDAYTDVYFIKADGTRIEADISINGKALTVKPASNLDYDTAYTLYIKGIKDIYGNTSEDKSIGFTTKANALYSATPKFYTESDVYAYETSAFSDGDAVNAGAWAYNPTGESKTAYISIIEVMSDGTIAALNTEQYELASGESKFLRCQINSNDMDNRFVSFVYNSENKPVSNDYAQLSAEDKNEIFPMSYTSKDFDFKTADIDIDKLKLSAVMQDKFTRLTLVSIYDEGGAVIYRHPVISGVSGEISLDAMLDGGSPLASDYETYSLKITDSKEELYSGTFKYVGTNARNRIKDDINAVTSSAEVMKQLINNEKHNLYLSTLTDADAKLYSETIFGGRPFADYKEIMDCIKKSKKLIDSINSSDWTELSAIITANSDFMMLKSDDMSKYTNTITEDDRSSLAQLIFADKPYSCFSDFEKVFSEKLKSYSIVTAPFVPGGGSTSGGSPGTFDVPMVPENAVISYFNDLSSVPWSAEYINTLAKMDIISVSPDGNYRPNDYITREEYVKLLSVAFGIYDPSLISDFYDVVSTEWYSPYIASMQKAGIVTGYNGRFGIGDYITRQDMVVMCYRCLKYKNQLASALGTASFTDLNDIAGYAIDAVNYMTSSGIVNGMGDGSFMPYGYTTRAQAAKVIAMLLGI